MTVLLFSQNATRMSLAPSPCVNCLDRHSLNLSREIETMQDTVIFLRPWMSARTFFFTAQALSWILIITSNIGMVANALVLTTYWKIGFTESINVSYFALGISDIGVLGASLWGAILNILDFLQVDLPFYPYEISSLTMYWPTEGFEKTTSCITAYIAFERCLCVLFPLHVKRFMSRKKTTIIVGTIFALVFGPTNLPYVYYKFEWRIDFRTNKSMLGIIGRSRSPVLFYLLEMLGIYINSVVHFTALIIIWICSAFLAVTLKRNVKERETNFGKESKKFNVSQARNKRVIKTVLMIASAYLIFSTPKVILNILSDIYDRHFALGEVYARTYMTSIIVGVQLSLFNSSVNLFIYVYTSSKFRETIQSLIHSQSPKA
ncbi:chemosensory receptor B [Elysia marginata]|uniref:Chemosensory receptor B n=1 Tax=Elysia marginata TaxID=1093978 RepID=A0AAV4ETH0_9GAST|nr:chemosensory receptor B [Elysia marginata]